MPENHENLPWEVRVIDVFQLTGREGVTVTAAWLSTGTIRSGDAAILLREDGEVRVDGLGIEFHAPENSGALFLLSLTKEDVAPGDRLVSVYWLGVASTTDIKFRASQLAIDYKDWETVLTACGLRGSRRRSA